MAVKEKNEGPISERMLQVVFQSFTDAEIEALRSSILDCALGIRLAVETPLQRPRVGDQYEGEGTDTDGGVWHVYRRPPDTPMLTLLFSHAVGRAGQRKQINLDPVIEVRHYVPGFVHVPVRDAGDTSPFPGEGAQASTGRALLATMRDELRRELGHTRKDGEEAASLKESEAAVEASRKTFESALQSWPKANG